MSEYLGRSFYAKYLVCFPFQGSGLTAGDPSTFPPQPATWHLQWHSVGKWQSLRKDNTASVTMNSIQIMKTETNYCLDSFHIRRRRSHLFFVSLQASSWSEPETYSNQTKVIPSVSKSDVLLQAFNHCSSNQSVVSCVSYLLLINWYKKVPWASSPGMHCRWVRFEFMV